MTYPAGFVGGGIPLGASPFSVRRAIARGGQVIRVVFSAEPKHRSSSALDDGLDPSNYDVAVLSGTAEPPRTVGVMPDVISFPAFALFYAGEYALDLQVDRPLVVGLEYEVTAKAAMVSAAALAIGWPYSADFYGAQTPTRNRQERRLPGLVDLASLTFAPGILVDSSGDWATQTGVDGTRKRCLRRVLTAKDSFAFLPGYGLPLDVKAPMTTARLTDTRSSIAKQIKQEPDVIDCKTSVAMDARGFLTISLTVKTAQDQEFGMSVQANGEGGVTVS